MIGVGATDASGRRAGFSNFGAGVDVTAPGSDIISLGVRGLAYRSGTSMAAAYVSATLALEAAAAPQPARSSALRDALVRTARAGRRRRRARRARGQASPRPLSTAQCWGVDEVLDQFGAPHRAHGGAGRRAGGAGPRRARRRRPPPRRDLHAAGDHVRRRPASDGPVKDRPFPLDLVPRILPAAEWDDDQARPRAAHPRAEPLRRRRLPRARDRPRRASCRGSWSSAARTSPAPCTASARRAASTATSPAATSCATPTAPGRCSRTTSARRAGISYVLENRVAMTRLRAAAVRALPRAAGRPLPAAAARRAARGRADRPRSEATVVVWTPGPLNSAYFEHAFLARQMGVELVEASDLVVRDDVLLHAHDRAACSASTRSTAASTTTSSTRSSSAPTRCSACPGLDARLPRRARVAIANAVGTGVADDKAIYHYVPEMIRYYLGEEPILENVPTYLLADARAARGRARRGCDELVVKPTERVAAARACSSARTRRRRGARRAWPTSIRARARSAGSRRSSCSLSTVPDRRRRTARSRPRHVDLRPFAVFGERHPHRPRRPDARRAARGLDDRQLLAAAAARRTRGCSRTTATPPSDGAEPRRADPPGRRRGMPEPALRRAGPASSSSSSSSRCSPGSPTSCSGSAATSRAPSTPRGCSTASSTPTCRAGPTTRGRAADAGAALLRDHERRAADAQRRPRRASLQRADARRRRPGVASSPASAARARARARCATSSRAEMWEAINTTHLGLLRAATCRRAPAQRARTRSTRTCASAARCSGALTSRTMLRDEATRSCRRAARDRVGRHGAADAARRAAAGAGDDIAPGATARRSRCCRRRRLPGLPPRGARRRPNALPGRALPALRARLPGLRRLRPSTRCTSRSSAPTTRRGRSAPVLRLSRLVADLEFRARTARAGRAIWRGCCEDGPARARARRRTTSPSATSPAPSPPAHRHRR